ncbi:MAG: hypothetical protein GY856_20570, partial [bacterium]|nr:hypothetical protein [bacterium]
MSRNLFLSGKNICAMLIAVSLAVTGPSFAIAPAAECTAAAVLDPNGTVRGYAGGDAEFELLRLDLPSPGIATLDVATPRVEKNPIRIDLLWTGCDQASPGDGTIVEQSAAHLVLAVRTPGTWWLRAATRGPGRYKVVTRFIEAEVREEIFAPEALPGASPVRVRRTSFLALSPLSPPKGTIAAAPRKSEPEIVDPDPNTQPVIAGPGDALLVRLLRLSPVVLPWKSEPEI